VSHADVFLAGKPSITFLKAFKKVMEGLVKNGGTQTIGKRGPAE
jgi:hypothetical protein